MGCGFVREPVIPCDLVPFIQTAYSAILVVGTRAIGYIRSLEETVRLLEHKLAPLEGRSAADHMKYQTHLETKVVGLNAENQRLREGQRWIPVSEKLPDSTGEYMVSVLDIDHYPDVGIALYTDETYADESGTWNINDGWVTHWRPLSDPPQEGE